MRKHRASALASCSCIVYTEYGLVSREGSQETNHLLKAMNYPVLPDSSI
jgi:hypothetical protein